MGCCQITASLGLSLIKCTLKESIMVPINDLIEPLKALQLSVQTEKRICSQEEIDLSCKIRGSKVFSFFDS